MPQINLLGQESQRYSSPWSKGPLYLVRIFVVIFLLLLAYWGFLYIRTRMITKEVGATQEAIIAKQKQILADPNRRQLLVRQGQLQAAGDLVDEHKYWSRLLPELARVTLKNASYISFSADTNNTARMSVTVPSYKDFDQFLQVFDLEDFSKHFSNVTVSSVGKYQQGDAQSVRFDIVLKYDSAFLKGSSAGNDASTLSK